MTGNLGYFRPARSQLRSYITTPSANTIKGECMDVAPHLTAGISKERYKMIYTKQLTQLRGATLAITMALLLQSSRLDANENASQQSQSLSDRVPMPIWLLVAITIAALIVLGSLRARKTKEAPAEPINARLTSEEI